MDEEKFKNQVCLIWLKLCTKQSYCGLLKLSEICHIQKLRTTITSTKDFEYTSVNRWRHLYMQIFSTHFVIL